MFITFTFMTEANNIYMIQQTQHGSFDISVHLNIDGFVYTVLC